VEEPVVSEDQTEAPAAVTPAPVPMPEPQAALFGVGPSLRLARERMGKSLDECAKQLRIRQPFLEALEAGRHHDLPGGTYATGFLRSYAEFLGLDGEELLRRFRQEGAGGFAARAELAFPSPVSEGRIPGGAVIFLGIILAAVAYGGWYALSSRETKVAEIVPPIPDRLSSMLNRQAALTGDAKGTADAIKPGDDSAKVKDEVVPPAETEEDKAPPPPAAPEPAKAEVTPPPLVAPIEQPGVKPAEVAKAPEPVKVEPPKPEAAKVEPPKAEPVKAEPPKPEVAKVEPPKAPAKPEAAPEPAKPEAPKPEQVAAAAPADGGKVFGTEFSDSRVVLKAAGEDCWIQVREVDGSLLLSRLLRKGDSFRVPNRPGLNLMVGNAGSLEVSVDGKKAPALGAAGQVRRDIRLDPDKLLGGG
jgi:cytoskeleton protein RodZ